MIANPTKSSVADPFKTSAADTGSTAVQVAMLTQRINHLSQHTGARKKDYSARLGLLKLVGQRRRLLNYLARKDAKQYKNVLAQLNLRK